MSDHRYFIFSVAINSLGRILLVRDKILGRVAWNGKAKTTPPGISRHIVYSGTNTLDAVVARPSESPALASVLICHGIGETAEQWLPVQQILASFGVASLVFDYSGYGRSSGLFHARQSEQDAIAAFCLLRQTTAGLPVSILGFSLGSGIATSILDRVPTHRLALCAAFTSLRDAAACAGVPRVFAFTVPPVWAAESALRSCSAPVLIVHGEKDRLFPVRMAAELEACCGSRSKLVIVPNLAHNEPFRFPKVSYWGEIVSRFLLEE